MDGHNQPLVASTLYCQPWHILPTAHAELGELYGKYLRGELRGRVTVERPAHELPMSATGAERISSGIAWAFDDELGVAVLWLEGIIAKRAPDMMSGPPIVDLARLDALLKEVRSMERISKVVLVFDSPGGSGIGLLETAELIGELAEEKQVVAYTDYQCCSAAYWLAAGCDEVYAAKSACIGSIGTYIAALDSSRRYEMKGLELKLFRHGSLKAIGMEGKAWTAEEEAYLEEMVESHGKEFQSWVSSRRSGIEESSMQGQWFFAAEAPRGLIDGTFRDLDELLAALLEE